MSSHTEVHEKPEQQDPSNGNWLSTTFTLLGLFIAVVGALILFKQDAVVTQLGSLVPFAVAAGVAALVPKSHGWHVRLPFAVMAALFTLFLVRMWPAAAETLADPAQAPVESHSILSWLIAMPMLGAIAILFLPRQTPGLLKITTLVIMAGTLLASLPLLSVKMGSGFHFNQDVVWIERFGIHYHVAMDGISLWLVVLTVFITPIATYASFGSIDKRIKDWCFSLLVLEAAMIGAFVSLDLFLFYVFWELMLIPMYVMIGVWGGTNRIKSAIKFFIYTMFGSVLMLAAILYFAYMYGKITGTPSFDYFELQRVVWPQATQRYLWAAFALSFLIKVPMFPVHTWLPDAHTEAPTAGSMILAAVMLKLGTYGYLRFCVGLFPEASAEYGTTLAGVAVGLGILYGALVAWRQDDVKRLVAYSSVAHLGYVMLGIFAATPSAIEGSVLQMVNHGISTGALFLLVGVVYDRRHTRSLADFGGLAKTMPVYATLFVIVTASSIGLPGTNGFVGEFMIITGSYVSNRLGAMSGIMAIGAAIGVIFGALYMLGAVQKMFFGPITKEENKHVPDINARELIAVFPLVIAIFVIGLFPNIFLDQIGGAAQRIQEDMAVRLKQNPGGAYYAGPVKVQPRRAEAPPPYVAPAADPSQQQGAH